MYIVCSYHTKNKVSLQINLNRNSLNLSYISFLGLNFENLTVAFHISYVLSIHIKFRSNWILFTIRSIDLFFIHNFKSQKLENLTNEPVFFFFPLMVTFEPVNNIS